MLRKQLKIVREIAGNFLAPVPGHSQPWRSDSLADISRTKPKWKAGFQIHRELAQPFNDKKFLELDCLEQLELRAMLAGNVSVSIVGEDLIVVGDRDANNVEFVVQGSDIALVGLADTTINGEEESFVVAEGATAFSGRVLVKLRGGDDRIVVQEGITFTDTVRLFVGAGDDSVGIAASDFERIKVVTFGGNDSVAIDGATASRIRVATRSGNDVISIINTDTEGSLVAVAGAGDDAVVIDGVTVGQNLRTRLGLGDDTLAAQDSDVSGRFKARGFLGADVFSIDSNTVSNRSVFRMGLGKDALSLSGNDFGERSVARGGWGTDQIENDTPDETRQVSFKADSIDPELLDERFDEDTVGIFVLSDQAQSIFNDEPDTSNEPLTLNTDFGLNAVNNVNGIHVIANDEFVVNGSTTPGAKVDVSTGGDGAFNDGTVTADQSGDVEVTIPLVNELAVTEVQLRASHDGEELTDSAEVFYAVNTTVRFKTTLGEINVELLPEEAPLTVRNFLGYLDRFDDLIVHRAPNDFVVQSGGFRFEDEIVSDVETDAPISSEFTLENSNLRGTLSMALLSGQPDSGTSGWFFNTSDNEFLDESQHTVFGRIDEASLSVLDAINELSVFNVRDLLGVSAFAETPLVNYSPFSEVMSGAVVITEGSATVTGVGTSFLSEIPADNKISIDGEVFDVASIDSETSLSLATVASTSTTSGVGKVNAVPGAQNFVLVDVVSQPT